MTAAFTTHLHDTESTLFILIVLTRLILDFGQQSMTGNTSNIIDFVTHVCFLTLEPAH